MTCKQSPKDILRHIEYLLADLVVPTVVVWQREIQHIKYSTTAYDYYVCFINIILPFHILFFKWSSLQNYQMKHAEIFWNIILNQVSNLCIAAMMVNFEVRSHTWVKTSIFSQKTWLNDRKCNRNSIAISDHLTIMMEQISIFGS